MYGKFLVEGDKMVQELLQSSFRLDSVYSVSKWEPSVSMQNLAHFNISEEELKKISTHETPDKVVAVAYIPGNERQTDNLQLTEGLYLACDGLNDPGNAGTIIRIADWFGVKEVFLSPQSVDIYNPKVVNAAKGSLFRVRCSYAPLPELFTSNATIKVYGAFLAGENIYESSLDKNAIIIIGNEANGISAELLPFVQQKVSIPSFGKAESLNAGVAAGIIVSEFRRRG